MEGSADTTAHSTTDSHVPPPRRGEEPICVPNRYSVSRPPAKGLGRNSKGNKGPELHFPQHLRISCTYNFLGRNGTVQLQIPEVSQKCLPLRTRYIKNTMQRTVLAPLVGVEMKTVTGERNVLIQPNHHQASMRDEC